MQKSDIKVCGFYDSVIYTGSEDDRNYKSNHKSLNFIQIILRIFKNLNLFGISINNRNKNTLNRTCMQ